MQECNLVNAPRNNTRDEVARKGPKRWRLIIGCTGQHIPRLRVPTIAAILRGFRGVVMAFWKLRAGMIRVCLFH